jgi:septum formation protein
MTRIVLASSSPRRAELLRAAGIPFDAIAVDVDETRLRAEDPRAYVQRLARAKAAAAAAHPGDRIIVGADTTVILGNDVFGKPADDRDAARMLERLSGQCHEVLTGLALRRGSVELVTIESTKVWFAPLDATEIQWYVGTREPHDKAGAYAVQGLGSRFIVRVDGSYTNVVGLPVATVYRLLNELERRSAESASSG